VASADMQKKLILFFVVFLGWRPRNGNRSNQQSKFDFLATRQCLVKIAEEQQNIDGALLGGSAEEASISFTSNKYSLKFSEELAGRSSPNLLVCGHCHWPMEECSSQVPPVECGVDIPNTGGNLVNHWG